MATFSKRQQQIPNPAREVSLAGAVTVDDAGEAAAMVGLALRGLAETCEIPANRVAGFLQCCFYTATPAEDAAAVHAALGLTPLPAVQVPDSGLALWQASLAVASGHADAVLVAGWDDRGAAAAVIADRETAETLSRGARRFTALTAMAAPGANGEAVDAVAQRARAVAGTTADAPSTDAGALDALRWLAGLSMHGADHTATVFVAGAQVTALVV